MDVERREDELVVVVLNVRERSLHVLFVVVVKQRDGSGDLFVAEFLPMFNDVGAHHVRDGKRAVVITFLLRHALQLLRQFAGQ